jgi:hypothetical protein
MQEDEAAAAAAAAGLGLGILIFYFLLYLVFCVPMMKIFTKAGKPGWAAFVPIYNIIVLLEIIGKPVWWIVLFFIPIVSFVMWIISSIALAERFGKGAGFGIGVALLWFVFLYILAFGDSEYSPPAPA